MLKFRFIIFGFFLWQLASPIFAAKKNESEFSAADRDSLFLKMCNATLLRYQRDKVSEKCELLPLMLTVDDVVHKAKLQNLQLKIDAERVLQAKENIKVSIGRLLPRLNFGAHLTALNAGVYGEFVDLAASFVGFLFPSNWFRWRESELYFEAERRGYAVLLANQVNVVVTTFYELSYIRYLKILYEDIISKVDFLAENVQLRYSLGEARIDAVIKIDNLRELLRQDQREITNELQKILYNLGFALNEPVHLWNAYDLAAVDLPDLTDDSSMIAEDLFKDIYSNSYELQELDYLIYAAHYSTKSRKFDFFNPQGDDNASLGLGYKSNIRIGKSQLRQLHLKREQMQSHLSLLAYRAVEDYNLAITSYKEVYTGLVNARQWLYFNDKKFADGGEYEISDFTDAIQSIFTYQSRLLSIQHKFLIAKAVIDRLLIAGPYYKDLLEIAPKTAKKLTLRRKLENLLINKARKSGKLPL